MAKSQLDSYMDDLDRVAGVETAQVGVDAHEIRKLLRLDGEMFIEFFLGDNLDMPVPEMHLEIWGLLRDETKERITLAIPRDHAKTTLAKLSVVDHWLHTAHRFCVYLSNTSPIAKGACKDIMNYIQCPNFVNVYGRIIVVKSSEQEGLWVFDLPLVNMAGTKYKRCILRALGWGQQMRGINIDNQRPDFAVVDDVEDNEVVDSPTQQKKLDKWIFGPFLKALARKKKIVWLGNMLAKTSLLARLCRSARWNPVTFGCLIKDSETGQLVPLWPDKWTVESLQEDYLEYKQNGLLETWMCEMMNMPGYGETGFKAEDINYLSIPAPEQCVATWLTMDPAFGMDATHDETAIAVHAIVRGSSTPRTVAIEHGHWDDVTKYKKALALSLYWNCWTWGIEAVAAQKVLITLFTLLAAQDDIAELIQFVELIAGRGDPKISRIGASVALMAAGEWGIPDSDIDYTTQLLGINLASTDNEDDIVDAVAYGPFMMDSFLSVIHANSHRRISDLGQSQAIAQTGVAACDI